MNVKEAIQKAKQHVLDLFAEEHITNLGLEEASLDEQRNHWLITIGFLRPWDAHRGALKDVPIPRSFNRTYKVVRIDQGGNIVSISTREPAV